ncbi:MAG: DegT/DnrJ/EryC1/StrS family aminotransferase [Acidobacteriota bacterium]|nr:DegT/DnrJ/EryC1/StrS family aminotransferase [Acidobacteriota bacterium]
MEEISFLDLRAQYQSIKQEIDKKILEVISSQRFVLGPEVENLEKELAAYSGTEFAVGVSSGSDALIISLMAIGIGKGDAVITSPFTFFATAGAISRLGARPVFCDIDPDTYNLSPVRLAELLEKEGTEFEGQKIKAIIPVHLYGQVVDMDPINELAKNYRLCVIEDAAQAVGSEYPSKKGIKKACSIGDMGILSFFPTKNLGGFGDGGMVLTNNKELADKLKLLRMHGSRNKYFYEIPGGNFRLDAIQAAILRVKLKHLDTWQEMRRKNASNYDRLFQDAGLVDERFVKIPIAVYKDKGLINYHTFHQYVIRAKNRDKLIEFLESRKVPTAIYYPLSLHLQKCFTGLGYSEGDFPVSEKASAEVLALPVYPELPVNHQEYIVASIKEFYKGKN